MTARRIAVLSAGLSTPSSTRLLADRLATATVDGLRARGVTADAEVVELRAHAPPDRCLPRSQRRRRSRSCWPGAGPRRVTRRSAELPVDT